MHEPALSPAPTYQELLRHFSEGAMAIVERLADETLSGDRRRPALRLDDGARHFAVLSWIVRRSIFVSMHLDRTPSPAEESEGRVMEAVDRVFDTFAATTIDAAAYRRAMDAQIDAEDDEIDRFEREVRGRTAASLLAGLYRDLGAAMEALPAEWAGLLPDGLRLLCTRAAAAAIRPVGDPGRVGHLMER